MKSSVVYFCLPLLLTCAQNVVYATPIRAVIETQNSQIVENLTDSETPTLSVNQGSLLPLTTHFSPISQIKPSNYPNWSAQLGHQIKVDSRLRDLSYTGKLVSLENQSAAFSLEINNKITRLPINDFYLVPSEENKTPSIQITQYPNTVSYQSNDVSWTPQRTLIFNNGLVSIINSADIHNSSTNIIKLKNSLLHYSSPAIVMRAKTAQNTMRLNESGSNAPNYSNNEITYPLKNITLDANSDTLVELGRLKSKINKSDNDATLFTPINPSGDIPLRFQNTLYFILKSEALPGQYQTFWQRDGLLIPSNSTHINIARAKQPIKVITNQSFDVTGQLSLIRNTSQKLPTTQMWEITISNHSKNIESYHVTQNTQGIINNVEGITISKKTPSSLEIKGKIQGGQTLKMTYTIQLKE